MDIERIRDNIYCFPVVLPENPLKWLNCYVIKGTEQQPSLLIDSGFHRQECLEALLEGMAALELKPENTDVFFTHIHSDHCGNAAELEQRGYRLMMGKTDYHRLVADRGVQWGPAKQRAVDEGMSREIVEQVFMKNPAVIYASDLFNAREMRDGDLLEYGGCTLQCIETPGHSPGHMCLYDRDRKIMLTGDHVLFDITPNITFWPGVEDSLGCYLENLKRMREFEVELALPAHRMKDNVNIYERIDHLLWHHEERLAEAEYIIKCNPGIVGYDIAGKMTWKIRAKNWAEFPPAQKWFAMGETISHLEYLERRGRIRHRTDENGKHYYHHTVFMGGG